MRRSLSQQRGESINSSPSPNNGRGNSGSPGTGSTRGLSLEERLKRAAAAKANSDPLHAMGRASPDPSRKAGDSTSSVNAGAASTSSTKTQHRRTMSPASTPLPDSPALLARRDSFVRTNSNLGKSESASIPDLELDNSANGDQATQVPADSAEAQAHAPSATVAEVAKDGAEEPAKENSEVKRDGTHEIKEVPPKDEEVKADPTPASLTPDSITESQKPPTNEEVPSASPSPSSPPPLDSQPMAEFHSKSPPPSSADANPTSSDALATEVVPAVESPEASTEEAASDGREAAESSSAETQPTDVEELAQNAATVEKDEAAELDQKSKPTPIQSDGSKLKSGGVGIDELQQRLKQVEQRFTGMSPPLLCHFRALGDFRALTKHFVWHPVAACFACALN